MRDSGSGKIFRPSTHYNPDCFLLSSFNVTTRTNFSISFRDILARFRFQRICLLAIMGLTEPPTLPKMREVGP